jgi:short subunit dehydrogenase-like uncharacterized protein
VDGESFAVQLCFIRGKLASLSMALSDGTQDPSWSTWSEKTELAKNRRHLDILARRYGQPPHKFPWGEITAAYDPRGGSSSISISYMVPHPS